ncbi:MAG: CRISPR-associated endonuclease Cas2 [Acidimicrobiaceae bacterium]|nr:CRISPR-associated endonuclease Cas2 [Acidimicrobiaceae bacterium]MYE09157.1 CRISPR-associated endonuclease Cas2 [Acidimicrobiaceae bacterium]
MDLLVAYDIADTQGAGAKRLRQVHDLCCAYGQRVQLSVFECRLTPTAFASLRFELERLIDPQQDSVHIYRFAKPISASKTVLGSGSSREVGEVWIL